MSERWEHLVGVLAAVAAGLAAVLKAPHVWRYLRDRGHEETERQRLVREERQAERGRAERREELIAEALRESAAQLALSRAAVESNTRLLGTIERSIESLVRSHDGFLASMRDTLERLAIRRGGGPLSSPEAQPYVPEGGE